MDLGVPSPSPKLHPSPVRAVTCNSTFSLSCSDPCVPPYCALALFACCPRAFAYLRPPEYTALLHHLLCPLSSLFFLVHLLCGLELWGLHDEFLRSLWPSPTASTQVPFYDLPSSTPFQVLTPPWPSGSCAHGAGVSFHPLQGSPHRTCFRTTLVLALLPHIPHRPSLDPEGLRALTSVTNDASWGGGSQVLPGYPGAAGELRSGLAHPGGARDPAQPLSGHCQH